LKKLKFTKSGKSEHLNNAIQNNSDIPNSALYSYRVGKNVCNAMYVKGLSWRVLYICKYNKWNFLSFFLFGMYLFFSSKSNNNVHLVLATALQYIKTLNPYTRAVLEPGIFCSVSGRDDHYATPPGHKWRFFHQFISDSF
jgi:hypothetical protein